MKRLRIGINGIILLALALSLAGCAARTVTVGLRPEYPKSYKRVWPGWPVAITEIIFTKIDTIEPTFRWDSFPRKKDLESEKPELHDELGRITDVTYDLKIFRAENDYPAELIYSKQGLTEPFHRIEKPLESCTKYFWSVRARFKLDSKTRVTGWSVWVLFDQSVPPEDPWYSSYVPDPYFYTFQTPCPSPERDRKTQFPVPLLGFTSFNSNLSLTNGSRSTRMRCASHPCILYILPNNFTSIGL